MDLDDFMSGVVPSILFVMQQYYTIPCKMQLSLKCCFKKEEFDDKGRAFISTTYIITNERQARIFCDNDAHEYIKMAHDRFEKFVNEWSEYGSGWVLDHIVNVTLRISLVRSVCGSSAGPIKLPDSIKSKKSVINLNVPDGQCIKYAIVASIHFKSIKQNRWCISQYQQFLHLYNFSCFTDGPVDASELKHFERLNPTISITAITWEISGYRLCYTTHNRTATSHAYILLYNNHWLPVTSLNGLMSTDTSRVAYCSYCLNNFHCNERLEKHKNSCFGQQEILPKEPYFQWNDMAKSLPPPYVMYCDIESLLQPTNIESIVHEHYPISVGYILVSNRELARPSLDYADKLHVITGLDCMSRFCDQLYKIQMDIYDWCKKNACEKMVPLTPWEEHLHQNATRCHFCNKRFFGEVIKRVAHHSHLSGKYIATTCGSCNVKMKQPLSKLPVIFHNLKGYDGHFIINALAESSHKWELNPVMQTAEKFISLKAIHRFPLPNCPYPDVFTSVKLHFIDSCAFLAASLDELVKSIPSSDLKLTTSILHGKYPQVSDTVLFGKGVFPYDFLQCESCLMYEQLPNRDSFNNKLYNNEPISDESYVRAQLAWQEFNCKTFKDYMEAYLAMDVLQLADVFESFRQTIFMQHELDPVNYITLPSLAWSIATKMNGCFHLLTDGDMYRFFEDGKRGGMSFINEHVVDAPPPANYDSMSSKRIKLCEPQEWVTCYDANNLYGEAMCCKLPCSNFKWVEPDELQNIDWYNIDTEGEDCYVLKVDLEYPEDIHDKTCDLPLAPANQEVTWDMLTKQQQDDYVNMCNQCKIPTHFTPTCRMLQTCNNKIEYVVHFKLLQWYLHMGMKIAKFHKSIKCSQAAILHDYIDMNSKMRAATDNSFKKNLYKLLNNAVYGKTMENVRKYVTIKMITPDLFDPTKKYIKYSSRPEYESTIIYSNKLIGLCMTNAVVKLEKPIYLGQAVLDLSKLIMYRWRYEHLPAALPPSATLNIVAGDTDSFFVRVSGVSCLEYETTLCNLGYLDTSNFDSTHPLFTNDRRAKLGCIKNEYPNITIKYMIFIRPKVYCIHAYNHPKLIKVTAKGINKAARKLLTLGDFIDASCYKEVHCNVTNIISKKHTLTTTISRKWALSCTDIKRAWIDESVSLPYGHYALKDPIDTFLNYLCAK